MSVSIPFVNPCVSHIIFLCHRPLPIHCARSAGMPSRAARFAEEEVEEGEQAAEARTKEGGATEEEPPERRCRGGRERERLALGGGAKREQWRKKGKRG